MAGVVRDGAGVGDCTRGLALRERMQQRTAIDAALAAWLRPQRAADAAVALVRAGIPAAALATSRDLVESCAPARARVLGTAWCRRVARSAVAGEFRTAIRCGARTGADTDSVLTDVLGMSGDDVAALRRAGALG